MTAKDFRINPQYVNELDLGSYLDTEIIWFHEMAIKQVIHAFFKYLDQFPPL